VDATLGFALSLGVEPLCFYPGFDVVHSLRTSEYFKQLAITVGEDRYVQPTVNSSPRSVLAFINSKVTLDLAEEWADGGALVAVPVATFDLSTWAREHDALNLLG
jgi:hypothetical protein